MADRSVLWQATGVANSFQIKEIKENQRNQGESKKSRERASILDARQLKGWCAMPDKALVSERRLHNPFTPEFGKVPAYLAGRESIVDAMTAAFDTESNSPDLCTLLVGARGTGKTALLSFLGMEAEQLGWVTASTTATPGMLDDLFQRASESSSHLVEPKAKRHLAGISVAGAGGIEWENAPEAPANWRTKMTNLLDSLAESDAGLLLMVDEIDPDLDELVSLVTVYQHFVSEGRKVALLMAGLPFNVLALLSGKSTSFLRRAARRDLGRLPDYEVREAFRMTVEDGGRFIEDAALDEAVRLIGGFPFMLQLLGYRAWTAGSGQGAIRLEEVKEGGLVARQELEHRVFDTSFAELSRGDKAFLAAMLEDDGPSSRADLMERLGKGTSHISTYKKRLIGCGLVDMTASGNFEFALPGFREYLEAMMD